MSREWQSLRFRGIMIPVSASLVIVAMFSPFMMSLIVSVVSAHRYYTDSILGVSASTTEGRSQFSQINGGANT